MDVIETLRDLVRINSVNAFYPGGPGESQCAEFIANYWDACGIEYWLDPVLPGRSNVIAKLPGRDPSRRLLLEAHMDTVSISGMTIDPFTPNLDGNRLYGRGSCDTKAGLAGMMCAVARAHRERRSPHAEVWMAAVVDEEYSCQGILQLCKGLRADAAIVAEPTEMKAVIASKGVLRWRIVAHGRAAHSSKVQLGVNAIQHMARLILEIESQHDALANLSHPLLGPPTGNIGLIAGGVQVNFVPDRCTIEIDRRLLPNESVDDVLAVYQRGLARVASTIPEASFEMEAPMLVDLGLETSPNAPIAVAACHALHRMGLDATPCGVAFGSDASKLSAAGIDSILFGPGSIDQAHAAVEYVDIDQVRQATEFYYDLMMEFGT